MFLIDEGNRKLNDVVIVFVLLLQYVAMTLCYIYFLNLAFCLFCILLLCGFVPQDDEVDTKPLPLVNRSSNYHPCYTLPWSMRE